MTKARQERLATPPAQPPPIQLRSTVTDAQIIGEQQREIRQLKDGLEQLGQLYRTQLERHKDCSASKSHSPTEA